MAQHIAIEQANQKLIHANALSYPRNDLAAALSFSQVSTGGENFI